MMDLLEELKNKKNKVKKSFSIDSHVMKVFKMKCVKEGVKCSPVVEALILKFIHTR